MAICCFENSFINSSFTIDWRCKASSHFPQNEFKQSNISCAHLEAQTCTAGVAWSILSSYLSRSPADRWGTTVDFTTSFLHSSQFSAFCTSIFHSWPVHSLMLSSHRFLCLPLHLLPGTVPCRIVKEFKQSNVSCARLAAQTCTAGVAWYGTLRTNVLCDTLLHKLLSPARRPQLEGLCSIAFFRKWWLVPHA